MPFASISHSTGRPASASWEWRASWPRRFDKTGLTNDKQTAADAATQAWWEGMATTAEPVDDDGLIRAQLDAILDKPHAFDFPTLSAKFLRRIIWHITQRWAADIKAETTPVPVAELMSALSAELFRRRMAGED